MDREETIDYMCTIIENMNRYQAVQQGMSEEDTNHIIESMRDQLYYMNSSLYDALYSVGVIQGSF